MKNILLLHSFSSHFSAASFLQRFPPCPPWVFFQIDLESFKTERLEFHCLAVIPASSTKLGLLAYLSVTCMHVMYAGEKECEGNCSFPFGDCITLQAISRLKICTSLCDFFCFTLK